MAKTQKQPTFEQKLEELEQIIGGLEQGDMPLDRAIATYKRGVELTRELKTQLGRRARAAQGAQCVGCRRR